MSYLALFTKPDDTDFAVLGGFGLGLGYGAIGVRHVSPGIWVLIASILVMVALVGISVKKRIEAKEAVA